MDRVARRRRWLWIGLVIAAGCGLLWSFNPLPDARARLESIPHSGAGFVSEAVPLTEEEQRAFAGTNISHRSYAFGTFEFFFTAIDGTGNRHAIHDPRYCLEGAGYSVSEQREIPLPGGPATLLVGRRGEEKAQAVFWFSDGATRHGSILRHWWQTMLRRLTLGRSGPEPVLFIIQAFGNGQPDWSAEAPKVLAALKL